MEVEGRPSVIGFQGSRCPGVLIAEDDPFCSAMIEKAFGLQGFATICVSDGQVAWDAILRHSQLDLVVLNWMLPTLDGHCIARRLHTQDSRLAIVLMIGREFMADALDVMDFRPHYLLPKPLDTMRINQQVSQIAQLAFCHTAARAQAWSTRFI